MGQLIGLPNVEGGCIDDVPPYFSSISVAMQQLKDSRAATTAGDHGAVVVYRADDGQWNCIFCRHMVDIDHTIVRTKAAVRDWLKQWLPRVDAESAGSTGDKA